jgi:hypothetical protein
VPYRVFPLNFTTNDTLPVQFDAEVGFENPNPGTDVVITLRCHGPHHGPHAVSDQSAAGSGPVFLTLDHNNIPGGPGDTGCVIRGTISTLDPLTERDAFEVTNIAIEQ